MYLFPAWILGVFLRYAILFPMRTILLFLCLGTLFLTFFAVHYGMKDGPAKRDYERRLVQLISASFIMSWHGVVGQGTWLGLGCVEPWV